MPKNLMFKAYGSELVTIYPYDPAQAPKVTSDKTPEYWYGYSNRLLPRVLHGRAR